MNNILTDNEIPEELNGIMDELKQLRQSALTSTKLTVEDRDAVLDTIANAEQYALRVLSQFMSLHSIN